MIWRAICMALALALASAGFCAHADAPVYWQADGEMACSEDLPGCRLLQMVMSGSFDCIDPSDSVNVRVLAASWPLLRDIKADDFSHFCDEFDVDSKRLELAYRFALANCLWADILLEGGAKERLSDARRVLLLFLDPSDEPDADAQEKAIRAALTDEIVTTIAERAGAPEDFVRWLIESGDWPAG